MLDKTISNRAGIYCIENVVTGKMYIGASRLLRRRLTDHFKKFRLSEPGTRANRLLFADWKKYGEQAFIIYVITYCDECELDSIEKNYIKQWDTLAPNGYNLKLGGNKGFKHSEARKKEMSSVKMGNSNPRIKKNLKDAS